jgi:trehalose/maltose hydrolase-like predicted phosphorylase
MLNIDPRLPPQWRCLSFRVCWQGRTVAFSIADGAVKATLATGEPMELRVAGSARKLAPGATLEVPL